MPSQGPSSIRIDADFPGGNILVDELRDNTVYVRQDLRDTKGDWFYWYFRVRGAAGRVLRFQFASGHPIGTKGPGITRDEGLTWTWLDAAACHEGGFTYAFAPREDSVRFSFGMPYVERDLRRFLARFTGHPALREDVLCVTPKGRPVERLRVGCPQGEPAVRVLITARHHCCEMMASYVLEGLVEAVLTGAGVGTRLREQAEFLLIPFVDKDGVEEGDQGKNRRPHDHNRDYQDPGLYVSTRAIRATVPPWAGGRLRVALDLHCPWIRGAWNELIYQVGSSVDSIYREQLRFAECLEAACRSGLPCPRTNLLPFGQAWNRQVNHEGVSFSRWVAQIPGIQLASTIEIPYATAQGHDVTPHTARAFGRDLARALALYLGVV